MIIMAIDPGSEKSGMVKWDTEAGLIEAEELPNDDLRRECRNLSTVNYVIAIEQIRGYGIVAGNDTFDTCQWSGRFQEAFEYRGGIVKMVPRKDVKKFLCGNTTTTDKYIRQALIDRLGDVGTKKNPGPLYGISGHLWSALAVAITVSERA
jgi:hypothetical protein